MSLFRFNKNIHINKELLIGIARHNNKAYKKRISSLVFDLWSGINFNKNIEAGNRVVTFYRKYNVLTRFYIP